MKEGAMSKLPVRFMITIFVMATAASAQTAVTTTNGGSAGTIPVFSGNANIENSVITQSNGNVGIGTTTPSQKLEVVGNAQIDGVASTSGNGALLTLHYEADGGSNYLQWMNASGTELWRIGGGMQIQENELSFDQGTTSRLYLQAGGNVGIGTTSPSSQLEVNGNVKLTSGSGASITFADGSVQSTAWNGTTYGGDYAESVDVGGDRAKYEPGDVMVVDPEKPGEFLKSAVPYSTTVAGIYSTKPGLVGRRQLTDKSHMKDEVPMAMTGIVPTKVTAENGPIKTGDLLVTSSRIGYAMKGTDRSLLVGAVVGKALAPLSSGTGVVEVLVTLQ